MSKKAAVSSEPSASEIKGPADTRSRQAESLVSEALEEYADQFCLRAEIREERALELLIRVAPVADCVEESLIYSENERVFCSNLDLDDITLEFFLGATSDQDFFTIHDYRGLPNPRPIRSLYELGQALAETGKLVAAVLQTFRETLLVEVPRQGLPSRVTPGKSDW
jgi:hypothetical protein